jgi:hypothetical protein
MGAKGIAMTRTPSITDSSNHCELKSQRQLDNADNDKGGATPDEPRRDAPDAEITPNKTTSRKFDPSRLRLSSNYSTLASVKKHILVVPIRKPTRFEWVQFSPDEAWRIELAVLVWKEERESYYVIDPDILPNLAMDAVPISLVTTVNAQGAVFLTPIRLPGTDGRHNEWHRSLLEASQMGMKGQWIRIAANQSVGGYEVYIASGELGRPTWPDGTFGKLLETAIREQLIDSTDHPILKRLRGES